MEYLKHPLDRATLTRLVERVDAEPEALVRKDPKFKALGLDPADYVTADAVVDLLVAHGELMQRPIAEQGERVVLARPKEKILDLL